MLTQAQIDEYNDVGAIVVPDVLTPEEVRTLSDVTDGFVERARGLTSAPWLSRLSLLSASARLPCGQEVASRRLSWPRISSRTFWLLSSRRGAQPSWALI